ncbi:hypothetical protein AcV7_009967 [Taiwanofungus camphoratus]|nr:hypothetical protein AcV7_009967 [Antrodia cinnamomea]
MPSARGPEWAAAADITKITGGGLDILVHNAARMEIANMYKGLDDYANDDELDAEFVQSVSEPRSASPLGRRLTAAQFKVNVLGVTHSLNALLPLLRNGSTKKIAVIGSERGRLPGLGAPRPASRAWRRTGTTKAATNMVATKYGALLQSEGFVVAALSPGLVDVSATGEPHQPRI